jgi:tripartite-type tricarboxylate transporter receptor subunit TctC
VPSAGAQFEKSILTGSAHSVVCAILVALPGRGPLKLLRRNFLHLAAGAAALPALSRIARAQAYPSRPITMVVTYPAGAGNDAVGRTVAERMRSSLGQPIVVENITGAEGSIGTGRAARARGDGYTIVLGGQDTHVINGALYSLQYDVLKDFAPILPLIRTSPILMGRPIQQ